MASFPEIITHNYDAARGIGKNICHLSDAAAERFLDEIRAIGGRRIRPNYLRRRRHVEDWLIAERRKKLGMTPLDRPIYFFLGDFADGKDLSRPHSLVMKLSAFRPDSLTFTYPDSMASLPLGTREEHLACRQAYHGHVFTLSEIKAVMAKFGLRADRLNDDARLAYDKFIEVQVWDDAPIRRFLSGPINIER